MLNIVERGLEATLRASASGVECQSGMYLRLRVKQGSEHHYPHCALPQEAGGVEYQLKKELTPLESRIQSLANAEEVPIKHC